MNLHGAPAHLQGIRKVRAPRATATSDAGTVRFKRTLLCLAKSQE